MRPISGMTTAQALEGARRGIALLKALGMSGISAPISDLIADIIGDNHPDLARLVERIERSDHAVFDATATLELLKSGMNASDVLDSGLDVVWTLSQQNGLDAADASHLMAMTVNTFAVAPRFFGVIPNHVASVARALKA